MKGKATIYDYARFMRSHCFTDDKCAVCPLENLHCGIDDFGKTVFLTKEEALKAVKGGAANE